jgi:hypothetical protein
VRSRSWSLYVPGRASQKRLAEDPDICSLWSRTLLSPHSWCSSWVRLAWSLSLPSPPFPVGLGQRMPVHGGGPGGADGGVVCRRWSTTRRRPKLRRPISFSSAARHGGPGQRPRAPTRGPGGRTLRRLPRSGGWSGIRGRCAPSPAILTYSRIWPSIAGATGKVRSPSSGTRPTRQARGPRIRSLGSERFRSPPTPHTAAHGLSMVLRGCESLLPQTSRPPGPPEGSVAVSTAGSATGRDK